MNTLNGKLTIHQNCSVHGDEHIIDFPYDSAATLFDAATAAGSVVAVMHEAGERFTVTSEISGHDSKIILDSEGQLAPKVWEP